MSVFIYDQCTDFGSDPRTGDCHRSGLTNETKRWEICGKEGDAWMDGWTLGLLNIFRNITIQAASLPQHPIAFLNFPDYETAIPVPQSLKTSWILVWKKQGGKSVRSIGRLGFDSGQITQAPTFMKFMHAVRGGSIATTKFPGKVRLGKFGGSSESVMELFSPPSSSNLQATRGGWMRSSPRERICILGQVLDGLIHPHQSGLAHRDLKPENLLLIKKPFFKIVITDFGLSKVINNETLLTTVCGTLKYIAPEAFPRLSDGYGPSVDIRR